MSSILSAVSKKAFAWSFSWSLKNPTTATFSVSIKFFKHGKAKEYTGGRTKDTILNWIEKKTGPPAVELKYPELSKKVIESEKVAVVGFFKDQENDQAKAFLETADSIDDIVFGITSEDAVFGAHEVDGDKIVLFKQFDEGRNEFDGAYEVDEITKFVRANSLPVVVEFSSETANKIFGGEFKRHLILCLSGLSEDFATQKEMATKIATEYKGKVLFVYVDSDKAENKRVLDFFGMKPTDVPGMRMTHMGDSMVKYKPEVSNLDDNDEFDSNVRTFVEDVLSGKLKPHLKSEEVPEDWDKEPVKVLVGKNFAEVALNADKNVLVEFYAPWCGHCKQLVPIWDKLGEKYKDRDDVVIAKIDSTANEIENVAISGFPTIKLFSKGDNKEVAYDGKRELEDFVKFLDKHSGVEEKDGEAGHDEL
jgi:protein disulfide-isomerase A1